MLRVGIDATPLTAARSGVGRYIERVSTTMAGFDDAPEQVWTVFSRRPVSVRLPAHTRLARRAVPARVLQPLWRRFNAPTAESLAGPLDVFHGGNFLVPPTRHAATVVTVHDLTFRFFPELLPTGSVAALNRLPDVIGGYDAVLTVSHAVADELVAELGVPRERIVVAHNGVDASWADALPLDAAARARLGVPGRYYVFLGTMEPRKNLPMLLAAHAAARKHSPELPDLVIVGGAGWGDPIAAADGVRVLGFLQDPDVRGLLAGAEALCSPSTYEGFGLSVLEGLATGRPVLASDIAAHREVAGGQAVLLPPTDTDAWAHALLAVAAGTDDPTAGQARRAVAAGYTWRASARIHLDLYRNLGGRVRPS